MEVQASPTEQNLVFIGHYTGINIIEKVKGNGATETKLKASTSLPVSLNLLPTIPLWLTMNTKECSRLN